MSTQMAGSCLCGAVRYELTRKPAWSHACHCSRCRKTTDSAFAANLFMEIDALRYVSGQELVRVFAPPDAERSTHHFCSQCGSTLPFVNEARGLVGVPMGTLDDDPHYSPRAHIQVGSKAPWDEIGDELPKHDTVLGDRLRDDSRD